MAYHREYLEQSVLAQSPISDAAAYHEMAKDLAQKGRWADPKTAHHTLGFPLVLAGIYDLFGPDPRAAYGVQAFIGLINLTLVGLLGWTLGGPVVGVLAALLTLLYGPLLFFESKLMPTTFAVTFNLGLILSFLHWRRNGYESPAWGLATGALAGGSFLLRPNTLLLVGALVVWAILDRRKAKEEANTQLPPNPRWRFGVWPSLGAAFFGLASFMIVGAWRNHAGTGEWSPLPATGGVTLYAGNNPRARGTYTPHGPLTGDKRHQAAEAKAFAAQLSQKSPQKMGPYEVSREITSHVFTWWLQNPWKTLRLFGLKLYRFCLGAEPRSSYAYGKEKRSLESLKLAPLTFPFLLVFALWGLLGSPRREEGVLWLYVGVHILSALVFFVSTRYRAPAVPVLAVLAASGARWWLVEARPQKALLAGIGAGLLIFFLHLNPFHHSREERFVDTFNEGIALQRLGRHREAIQRARSAQEIKPGSAKAWVQEGNSLVARGRLFAAASRYRKATRIDDSFPLAHLNLGVVACRQNRFEECIAHLKKALSLSPRNPLMHLRLGQAYRLSGKKTLAREALQRAITLSKGSSIEVERGARRALRRLNESDTTSKARGDATSTTP